MTRPHLEHLSEGDLLDRVGGDPWAIDWSLQAGSPTQIDFLAQAFHQAAGSATAAEESFRDARLHFRLYRRENGERPINNGDAVQRIKDGLRATTAQLGQIAAALETIAGDLAEARVRTQAEIDALNANLEELDGVVGYYDELHSAGYDCDALISNCVQQAVDDTAATLHNVTVIRKGYAHALRTAHTDLQDAGYIPDAAVRKADAAGDPDQVQHQVKAFQQVFGRAPVSANDWTTAAALDPHSYDRRNGFKPPEIRVVRINPVPGQGVVRSSQWIEQRDVTNLHLPDYPYIRRDLGNDRPADPDFDPENTKLTTYIDYDNGIVVMRQNPSAELDPAGRPGRTRVGVPEGTVTQASNGAVRIRYSGANPFAPVLATKPPILMQDNPWTVNGDLVFTPTDGGVRVDGTRTDYPSLEVYQDLPTGSTRTVIIDPAQSGRSWGPMLNLPGHHDVGSGGAAFKPFDTGGFSPRYDVPAPLPQTEFGPVDRAPSVPTPRTHRVAS